MTFEIGVAIPLKYYTGATGATVNYTVEDESGNLDSSGTLVESVVITGLYEGDFTPDAAGVWCVIYQIGTTSLAQSYPVEFGSMSNATYGLSAINTKIVTVDANQDVATTDGASNALERDVIGAKDDAAVIVVGTTKSAIAYEKGILTQANAIKAKTDLISGATVVATDLATALTNVDLDHVVKTSYGAAKPTDGSLLDQIMSKDVGQTFDSATDSLEAIANGVALIGSGALAVDASGNHNVTTVNDTVETQVFESTSAKVRAVSVWFDLDALVAAGEGGQVSIRLYNYVDGAAYSDVPSARSDFTVGTSTMYPSIEAGMITGNVKVTIQCGLGVTSTRNITYRYIVKELS
jgi:hypothetical protein